MKKHTPSDPVTKMVGDTRKLFMIINRFVEDKIFYLVMPNKTKITMDMKMREIFVWLFSVETLYVCKKFIGDRGNKTEIGVLLLCM